jgi:hypothetical protein
MAQGVARQLIEHLVRDDGQEDLCLAVYSPSTGLLRDTAILKEVVLPEDGERRVHGNATITGTYVLRAATMAAKRGLGVAILHSHPHATGWQEMSGPDRAAEASYAFLVHRLTGLPLVGMTLGGGNMAWSARAWAPDGGHRAAQTVRTVGKSLRISYNDTLLPRPASTPSQARTVSAWGETKQADIARLRVLVIGVGSVGMPLAVTLAASGIEHIGIMDPDRVESVNLDRLVHARRRDALFRRLKVRVAAREVRRAATARRIRIDAHPGDITQQKWLKIALDYDVIFSCVDRPHPRAVLNEIAYSDLIPVIDGGIKLDPTPDGTGLSSGTWRAHVLTPGTPCMECIGQIDAADVSRDMRGLLDDPEYIKGAGLTVRPKQNVALLSASVTAALQTLFVSLVATPGGRGVPRPLRYMLSIHQLEHVEVHSQPHCTYEGQTAAGDTRVQLTTGAAPNAPSGAFGRARAGSAA